MTQVVAAEPESGEKPVHFFVDKIKVTTGEDDLNGRQIKALAGVDPTDLLELREGDERIPVGDDQVVEVKDGAHFKTYPGGKDS